jgi:hypothetical protein
MDLKTMGPKFIYTFQYFMSVVLVVIIVAWCIKYYI